MKLKFSDGITIETSGPPRILKLSDGYYAVGNGTCTPCRSRAEAYREVYRMKNQGGIHHVSKPKNSAT